MARNLTPAEVRKIVELLQAGTPRAHWQIGKTIQAALGWDKAVGKYSRTIYRQSRMKNYGEQISKIDSNKAVERTLFVCRDLASYLSDADIRQVEDAGLTLRQTIAVIALDKAATEVNDPEQKARLTAARRDYVHWFCLDKQKNRDFYKELAKLKYALLGRSDPTQASPKKRLARLRRGLAKRVGNLLAEIYKANACLQEPSRKQRARKSQKIIANAWLDLDQIYK